LIQERFWSGTRVAEEDGQLAGKQEIAMRSIVHSLSVVSALAVGLTLSCTPDGRLAAPAYAKKDKGPGFAAETFINAAPVVAGSVRRFLVNPHGEVDGLLLADGTIVKFRPHMGAELIAVVKANDAISVRGYREPSAAVKAIVVVNEGTRQQVVERPPGPDIAKMPKHLRFAALSRLKVMGKIERQMRGKKGEVNGVLLSDGTVVRFPPHVAFDFAVLLQPGLVIAAEGLGTENAYGRGLEATAMGPSPEALRPFYGR
jgi:hypothetical protein